MTSPNNAARMTLTVPVDVLTDAELGAARGELTDKLRQVEAEIQRRWDQHQSYIRQRRANLEKEIAAMPVPTTPTPKDIGPRKLNLDDILPHRGRSLFDMRIGTPLARPMSFGGIAVDMPASEDLRTDLKMFNFRPVNVGTANSPSNA